MADFPPNNPVRVDTNVILIGDRAQYTVKIFVGEDLLVAASALLSGDREQNLCKIANCALERLERITQNARELLVASRIVVGS